MTEKETIWLSRFFGLLLPCRPVILKIRSGDMHRAGQVFYSPATVVWPVDQVPRHFIE